MIKVGDLVMLKNAKIRGPDGTLKELEEAPDYGVVLATNVNAITANEEDVCRVMWFDRNSGPRTGNKRTTLEFTEELEKISK